MRHHNTLLHNLLQFIPWSRFEALVDEHGSDRRVRKLSSKSQLIALVHAQLSGVSSLREVEATLASQQARLYHLGATAPKRSTLADANAERSADVFCGLFEALLAQAHPGLRKASREAVRLIDATSVSLTAHAQSWAGHSQRGCGAKLHVVLDPDAALPVHFVVTSRRVNDITPAKAMPIEAGATYVFDLGYYDFAWWAALDAQGCRFVTRLKTHTRPTLIEERHIEPNGSVIADRIICLANRLARNRRNPLDRPLREIHVRIDTGKTLRLVSNDLDAPAHEIADLYKRRWDIELFFRWVKQTLKIRRFLGTKLNAIRTQVAAALIAYLLLRMAHAAQCTVASILTFARLVRANLMHSRSIHQLAAPPPPRQRLPGQLDLRLC
ncbi:MAG: IS4 family transposase [Pseudomonadota bacterium]|nr:IS4 family transposase [Pseudomonadota bacterium]